MLAERERTVDGGEDSWLTVFLAGAECPFTCVFCDLWRHTLDRPTPRGAIPAQIRAARRRPPAAPPPGGWDGIKLYNASNFFEERAVPAADDTAILAAVVPYRRVLVECHPRWVGERCVAFASRLAAAGGRLEVALGLETVHPEALAGLGKGATVDSFTAAAGALRAAGCGVRAFLLVGAPGVPRDEDVGWVVASVRAAVAAGAEHVSLIPVRDGNGALEALAARGGWSPPTLADLETALDASLEAVAGDGRPAVVTADLWDVQRFAACPRCADARVARLARLNASGRPEPAVTCAACG